MAEKTINDFIEELVESVSSTFKEQKRQLENYQSRYEKAKEEGASKEYLGVLNNAVLKLTESIEKQRESANEFYEEMVNLAGGRRDLDSNMLKDVMAFRQTFVEMNEKIKDLQESYRNEQRGNNNQAELHRIELEIKEKRAEYMKKYSQLKRDYGINSYATQAANNFVRDAEAQAKVLENIQAQQKASAVNQQEIGRAMARNNRIAAENLLIWDSLKKFGKEFWGQLKDGGNMWLKFNAQAISDSKRLGFVTKEAARGYTKYLMDVSKDLSRNFGMTAEQAMKMQEAFSKATGKASLLSKSQMEDIAASSKLMGEEAVSNAIEMMDNMGSTSQQATELLDKNYARAVNSGLDTVKASDAFVKNMSLANKMSFRNGVDGISKMTIMSQRIKLNLQEVANVAEKFGSIEGAIEGSAQLQMLGGAGAMFGGNPMEMMYEALSDPEALYERMGKMFGEQARFDRKTGEARIDPIQLQIIREQAKAMGMSADEAVQSAKAQAKNKDIEGYASDLVRRYGRNSDELATITNKAQFNKETGQWQITYQDETGETHENVDVKTLTAEQMKDIMKDRIEPIEDIRKRVKQIAIALIGTKENWDSMLDVWRTSKAQAMNGIMEYGDDRIRDVKGGKGFLGKTWDFFNDGGVGTWAGILGISAMSGVGGYLSAKYLKPGLSRVVKGGSLFNRTTNPSAGPEPINSPQSPIQPSPNNPAPQGGGTTSSRLGNASRAGRAAGRAAGATVFSNMKSGWFSRSGWNSMGKMATKGGIVLSVAGGALRAYSGLQDASVEHAQSTGATTNLQSSGRIREREAEQRNVITNNRRTVERSEAIGEGIGTAAGGIAGIAAGAGAGAAAGAALGSVIPGIGTAVGLLVGTGVGMIGAYLGKKAGGAVGEQLESHGKDDVISKELDEINDSNEKENLRRIVLPIESIDYNVALIANQLGIISAMPSRDNIYLKSEGVGETKVEFAQGLPLEASHVNEVDANTVSQRQSYAGGTVTLNVNGTIELTGGGQGVGKLTAQDIKQIIDNNQELQRHIADIITGRQGKNGNAGRTNYENADNRRATTSGTYVGGI